MASLIIFWIRLRGHNMNALAYQRWLCDACGYIYDEAEGDPDSGLPPGTRYQDIPDDWQCPLCGMTKSDLRLLPDAPAVSAQSASFVKPSSSASTKASRGGKDYVVIVGAGIAGWSAAEAIRQRDPDRPVLLVTACKGLVYPKPALSLAISQGRLADDLVDKDAVSRAAELNIEVRTETRILKIDRARKKLTTAKGGIEYGKLVLALGAHQRVLPVAGDAADTVVRVNDLGSFKKLQQRLSEGVKTITILGAGLIGSEFADDFTRAGYHVNVVDPGMHPLAGLIPQSMAFEFQKRLSEKGVTWHFGVTLKQLDKIADGFKVELSNGDSFASGLVLSAAGLVTNTALAEKSGLAVDVGIVVDHDMHTSDADIYALGDCASVEGRLFAYIEPIRRQAKAIASNLNGDDAHFVITPPMIKIKTQSMPMSVCRPIGSIESDSLQMISNDKAGCHFEILDSSNVVGFALSDSLAAEAGSRYQKLNA